MPFSATRFSCVAQGTFSQADEHLFAWSSNAQCVANAACALAWNFLGGVFSTANIDGILRSGDRVYRTLRDENCAGESRYLFPEELPRSFLVMGHAVQLVDLSHVHDALYPATREDVEGSVTSLSGILEEIMSVDNVGFLFTGQLVTVSFWRRGNQYFLFDSHAVNLRRQFDLDRKNNLARLFRCDNYSSLAMLLLSNASLDGLGRQYTVTRVTFGLEAEQVLTLDAPCSFTTEHGRESVSPLDPKLFSMTPVVVITRLDFEPSASRRHVGRLKKAKRGRPKVLQSTRDDQLRKAKKRYATKKPDKNKEAVLRYVEQHPEVHREAVRRFAERKPEVNRDAVLSYRQRNPGFDMRHLPVATSRQVTSFGPMGHWKGDQLENVRPFKLKKTSLWAEDIRRCCHCGARLFDEEANRKKWCCADGAYNVLRMSPLDAPFYSNRSFLQRARAYNDIFAFCALEVSGGYRHPSGLAFFKIEGKIYHQVHSLDAPGQKFTTQRGIVQFLNGCRLYIDDGEERRNIAMGRSLNADIVQQIGNFLDAVNPFVGDFRRLSAEPSVDAHLSFELTSRSTHGPVLGDRQRGVEVHAVLSTEETANDPRKLTIWKRSDRRPSSIDLMSPLMEPFQYPLLYPQGDLGWHVGRLDNSGRKLSQYNYARCLLLSDPRFSHLGRLSQAWQVEMFARYEEERLRFIRFSQTRRNSRSALRIVPLDELLDSREGDQVMQDIVRDETVQGEGGIQPGKVYLPSSFTGGPRYMKVHYENAMGLVSRLGSPTFFLTFTYSATWEENKKACPRGSGRSDPATACRVFNIKLGELIRDLRSGTMFGPAVYFVYVIEIQMRGLPHAHIVFKIDGDGPVQAPDIDSVIRADIPPEVEAGGRLRELVLRHMIHGPCGTDHRTDFPCWDHAKGCCNKFFPKPACQTTHVDERGFVQYRRDYDNRGVVPARHREVSVHDGWVVPYNPALLLKYEAHINLELASTRRVVKYLFKYLMKGGSLQNVTVTPLGKQEDEIEHYVTKRMVGASDACWRLLDFPVSRSEPTVECLPVHLEGKQPVIIRPGEPADETVSASSKLIVYFDRPHHEAFDEVTYQSFYERFMVHTKRPRSAGVYEHPDGKHFVTPRQRGAKVCRLFWVSPNRGEQYYLRILLMSTPCRGYAHLLSLGGPGCRTFQDVARNLGLVEDEEEYRQALREASTFMLGPRLRSFFVILCNMGAPAALLWDFFKNSLCEDHLERNPEDPELAYKLSLIEIDRSLRLQGSSLTDHGLPHVQDDTTELGRELLNYGENLQRRIVEEWEPKLSHDQRRAFEYLRSLITHPGEGGNRRTIFLDGPGGYGKTALIRVILAYVRSCRQVALAVASSGIAAANMAGGTTAHSMFRLPLDLGDGTGFWNITNGSQRAQLIKSARVIVFDEAPMAHRFIFEILDRSLRDLMNSDDPFGGKIFLCSGDFRQIAPVVEKARTPGDVSCVSLRASRLWRLFRVFSLTTPQRTRCSGEYSEFLIGVGNGTIASRSFGEGRERETLIPLLGMRCLTSLDELIADVFPPSVLRDPDLSARRSILSTLNVNVKEINRLVLNSCDGRIHELRSADTVEKEDDDGLDVDVQLLNQATGKGVPDHVLQLKVGSVCLIMRNLNIGDGLVNGTKVIVTAISSRLITVRLPGRNQPIGIPRITFRFAFTDGSPLRVRRRQFPLMLAYSMTGHKSQGQTIEYVGVDLRTDCFTHGQLYVLLSRVRRPDDIVVLVPRRRVVDGVAYARNIVYGELL